MKISITNYPFYKYSIFKKKFNGGPYIFLRRLSDSLEENYNLKIKPFFLFPDYTIYLGGKKIRKKNYILRLDGVNIDIKDEQRKEKNKIISENIYYSSGIIFHSEFSKKIHEKYFDLSEKKYKIIHNGVPLNKFNSNGNNLRKLLGFKIDDFIIICSGRWKRRHKRLIEIIEFFNIISENISNYNFKLLVLGDIPINFKTNNEKILFAGDIDVIDLPNWYRTGNLYIHMAWIEPSGNSHLEAIASGLPVLCVNNGGLKETVKLTNSGIVSKADKEYDYELTDYYNPPKPNFNTLFNDFKKLILNYNKYKNQIYLKPIDIKNTAKEYLDFIYDINTNKQ